MDISSINMRDVYINNLLYTQKRATNRCFQRGLYFIKQGQYPQAVTALKEAICKDKYNEDAKYLLQYINEKSPGNIGNCLLDCSGCKSFT